MSYIYYIYIYILHYIIHITFRPELLSECLTMSGCHPSTEQRPNYDCSRAVKLPTSCTAQRVGGLKITSSSCSLSTQGTSEIYCEYAGLTPTPIMNCLHDATNKHWDHHHSDGLDMSYGLNRMKSPVRASIGHQS